ncbi:hypothetical protein AYR62_00625 [Secundilactobacillus paracollinoides]|uniref:SUF system FeS cluster assembly SufBD core domain-containing protein n=1 Tax=Secundilactobacillus paracollinoides TaxID=240427 RepID=A0A1B2IVN3_9LACO|nr:SufD family Fe-S cluster assembly protein [Secundilactobacillus paracollinoides]ANZ60266.1 hypothetical protein AYR61_02120 [Secundilactobacillus paracollinoides]ANZ62746.1 hypothetical protein AYR62_00625 [Secundilactobacillus paracollinoides]ANZ66097.1 hypothetical protein AYR63_02325 [Secundilactobacillus paracollinoides]
MTDAVQDEATLKANLEDAANEHGEPHWFVDRRLAALDQLATLPLPTAQGLTIDEWPLMPLDKIEWRRSDRDLAATIKPDDQQIQLVQLGQKSIINSLPDDLDDQDVVLTDVFTALREHPQLIERRFMSKMIPSTTNRLTSYHLAYLSSGIFLYMPKDVKIDQPIDIELIQDSTRPQPLVSHVFVVAESGSQCQLTIRLATKGDTANTANLLVEVMARADSHLDITAIDALGANTTSYIKRHAVVSRDATVNWHVCEISKGNTIAETTSDYAGSGAQSAIISTAVTDQQQQVAITTAVTDHGKLVGEGTLCGVQLGDSTLASHGDLLPATADTATLKKGLTAPFAEASANVQQQICDAIAGRLSSN